MIPLRLKQIIKTYQEIVVWMPPAILAVFLALHYFPQIDPRSGIDGLGQLFAMLVNVVGGIIVCFSAWLTKRAYLGAMSDEDILQLQTFLVNDRIDVTTKRTLIMVRLQNLLEWILCFAFWYLVVF